MRSLDSKIVEYIVPDSESNSDAEAYEYFIMWQNPDGGVYCWMFEDFEKRLRVRSDIINTKSENISNLYKDAAISIKIVAEDLSENEFDVISGILRAKIIRRYYKDGTYKNLAIKTNSFKKQKSDFRYNINLEVQEKELSLLR